MQFNLSSSIDWMTDNAQTYVTRNIKKNPEIYQNVVEKKAFTKSINMDSFQKSSIALNDARLSISNTYGFLGYNTLNLSGISNAIKDVMMEYKLENQKNAEAEGYTPIDELFAEYSEISDEFIISTLQLAETVEKPKDAQDMDDLKWGMLINLGKEIGMNDKDGLMEITQQDLKIYYDLKHHNTQEAFDKLGEYDQNGNIVKSNIFKTVIKVTKRMTYDKVFKVISNDNSVKKEYGPYINDILIMKELAVILNNRRKELGSINFDIPDTKVVLDDNQNVIDIKPYNKTIANDIIEEFMLAANMTVAKTFYFLNLPFIYRIHEKPDEEKLRELNEVLANYKKRIKGIKNVKPKVLSKILDEFDNEEEKQIVSTYMLRTLKLAKYSEECQGHFGLAAKYYCHFTSPIRRYPDLFIHRVISDYIAANYNLSDELMSKYLVQARKYAITSSEAEKQATNIERDFDELYKVIYMKNYIDKEFEAVVSSVTSFGMFVKLENTVEGLIPFSNMPNDDYYEYDENRKILFGKRNGKIFKIGDKVKVKLVRCDVREKQIDFLLV